MSAELKSFPGSQLFITIKLYLFKLFFSDVLCFPHTEEEAADIPKQYQQDPRTAFLAEGLRQTEAFHHVQHEGRKDTGKDEQE